MQDVYIVEGKRSALGSFLGGLSELSAAQIASQVIKGLLENSSYSWENIDYVFLGQVLQAGAGQAPARQAAILAGAPDSIPCTTINKVCGSGLESIIMAYDKIKSNSTPMSILAGGMENMSLAPHAILHSRVGQKYGPLLGIDILQHDGLTDPYSKNLMGTCAELCAQKYEFGREKQDAFAQESYQRAQVADKNGVFKDEIVPIIMKSRKGEKVFDKDEGIDQVDFEKMKKIAPAFDREKGTITAANASTINDGAASLILSNSYNKDKVCFKILSYASHAQDPSWFSTAPIESMKKALVAANLTINDIDLFEINEAFSVVPMAAMKELAIDHSKVNIYGGAVALGHPLGASGARIVVTLMNALKRTNKKYGLASLCIGGGEGLSLVIEKFS